MVSCPTPPSSRVIAALQTQRKIFVGRHPSMGGEKREKQLKSFTRKNEVQRKNNWQS